MTSGSGWRRLQDLGLQLLDEHDPESMKRLALKSLLQVVGGEVAGEIELNLVTGRSMVTELPDLLVTSVDEEGVAAALAAHPALPHLRRHGSLDASRVEDLCGEEAWRGNAMRRELLDPHGVPHALMCAYVTTAGVVRGWGINRSRPFNDDEQNMLAAFEPFLRRAAEQREQRALLLDLDRAVADGAGLLVLRQGQVAYVNMAAERLLNLHDIPLRTVRTAVATATAGSTVEHETVRGQLRLHLRPSAPGTRTIVLTGVEVPTDAGITPRQQTVLCYLAEGLTATAIARRVKLSPRTVEKHLENLYRRLNARDRLDAVLRAQSLGLLLGCAYTHSAANAGPLESDHPAPTRPAKHPSPPLRQPA